MLPEYITGDANFRIKTSKTGMLKFYVNSSYNNIGLRNPDIDSTNLKSSFQIKGFNTYSTLSYREFLNDNWKIDVGVTYNYSNDSIHTQLLNTDNQQLFIYSYPYNPKNNTINTVSNFANAKMVFTRFFSHNQALRFGTEHLFSDDNYSYNGTSVTITDNLTAAFAEGDIYLAPNIATKIGVRYEYSALVKKSNIAPRISFAFRFNDGGQINLAYGIFYQKPDYGITYQSELTPIIPTDFLSQFKKLDYTSATHYIINYTKKSDNRLFRVEAYYKVYDNLVKTYPTLNNNGTGYARGIELFWRDKKTIKNLDYWITYTFLDTKREYLNYPTALNPNYTTPHTVSIVAKRFFEKLNTSFNVAYSVATGRPYYNIRYDSVTAQPKIYDNGTTNTYQTLNLSVSYLCSFFKKWKNPDFTVVAFGVNNILGNNQVFGYNYSVDGSNKVPITLPASRSVFVGIFMSFGINRTKDFINENL